MTEKIMTDVQTVVVRMSGRELAEIEDYAKSQGVSVQVYMIHAARMYLWEKSVLRSEQERFHRIKFCLIGIAILNLGLGFVVGSMW